ncbi:hypothetical protein Hanom_Chr16g01513321 [Helianthus anomalus]
MIHVGLAGQLNWANLAGLLGLLDCWACCCAGLLADLVKESVEAFLDQRSLGSCYSDLGFNLVGCKILFRTGETLARVCNLGILFAGLVGPVLIGTQEGLQYLCKGLGKHL